MWRQKKHVKLLKYKTSDTVTMRFFYWYLNLKGLNRRLFSTRQTHFLQCIWWWNKMSLLNKLTNNCFACSAHQTLYSNHSMKPRDIWPFPVIFSLFCFLSFTSLQWVSEWVNESSRKLLYNNECVDVDGWQFIKCTRTM